MDDPAPPQRPRPRASRRLRPRRLTLTDDDVALLRFMADHGVVVTAHVQRLLGISHAAAGRRIGILGRAGFLETDRPYAGRPSVHRPTAMGLRAAGTRFRTRRLDHLALAHDLGLGWLWLAAHRGIWGELAAIVPERRMRSADARAEPGEPTFALRTGGLGTGGRPRLHFPDLMLQTPEGGRIAVELELSQKGRTELEAVMGAYALERRVDAVLYLVEDRGSGPAIGRAVEAAALSYGLSDKVQVQRFARGPEPGHGGPELAAARTRTTESDRRCRGEAER